MMTEDTLDPKDWEAMRQLGHTMIDDMIDYLSTIRDQPVWKPFPDESKYFLSTPIPKTPSDAQDIYDEFKEHIFPYTKGNIHPRFWAWVQGTGTPLGVLADMMASAMNPNATIGEQSAMYVDQQVVSWCKQMMGFGDKASGMLLSGGSMANTTALIVARNAMNQGVREKGLKELENQSLVYCSNETHSCIQKAVEVIGIGSNNLIRIRTNADYTIDTEELEKRIQHDLSKGCKPMCVVANVGTVNTGAIDDLKKLRLICDQYHLWMHIDGAFGALGKLLPEYHEQLQAIEEADSIAFDLHKWMYMPYEVGCVLIKDKALHRSAFTIAPSYLLQHERGLAAGPDSLNNFGIELSRGFKALKVWMSIKEHGIIKYSGQIEKNIQQARYLANLVSKSSELEMMAPVPLNIVCFRYIYPDLTDDQLNFVNKEIVMALQEQGIASPSSTMLNGHYVIRVAITNHRSIKEDFDYFLKEVKRLGAEKWVLLKNKL